MPIPTHFDIIVVDIFREDIIVYMNSIDCKNKSLKNLIALIEKHTSSDGINPTAIPSLKLVRASEKTEPLRAIYEPSLLFIAQGSKIVMLSNKTFQYDSETYLVASVHLPITGTIIKATPEEPYLCVQFSFEQEIIFDILRESGNAFGQKSTSGLGLQVNKTTFELLDVVLRLVRLLDSPKDVQFLLPLITREILYRLLQNDASGLLKQFAILGTHAHSISKSIQYINNNYSVQLRVEDLANEVNMSPSAFYSYFKKVTTMSPIQYQKQLRLMEARRLLLTKSMDAADVAFHVGYTSPSQFNREYKRMYGLPPISDTKRIKNELF